MVRILVAFLFLAAAAAAPAEAGNPGKGKGKGPPAEKGNQGGGGGDRSEWRGDRSDSDSDRDEWRDRQEYDRDDWRRFSDADRRWYRDYWRDQYAQGHCPPGLAKKNNGCLPPGQAKKAWVIGQPLPPQIVHEPMPRALRTQLTPPPPGYEYVRVADDIVLMSTATRVIGGLLGNLGNFSD